MAKARPTRPDGHDRYDAPHATASVFDLILDQVHDGICVQDAKGRIEWMNPACEEMFGWTLEEVRGRAAPEFILPADARPASREIAAFHYDFDSTIFGNCRTTQHVRRDGTRFWNRQSFSIIELGPDDQDKRVVITCRDVTERVEAQTALRRVQTDLEYAAYHDELTGLANRKKLGTHLTSDRIKQAALKGTLGVLQIDIDKFKDINDTLGHAAGDATLCHVADALRKISTESDLACRTGGDEFLLICPEAGSRTALAATAENLLAAISAPLAWQNQTIRIGASIGISMAASSRCSGEELIQHADQALYSAKNGGRGHVVFFTDRLGRAYSAHQKMVRDLRTALAEGQFEVHLQPQLCLASNCIIGVESLIRWHHPDKGLLPPDRFLPTAEKCGLLAEIDYNSMNMALDALCQLRENGNPDISMSINVSSSVLDDVNYPGLLDWALQSRGIDPGAICIEILETTILDGGELEIATTIGRLRHLGVRIALDDFGTGYAGLAHMSAFEIDAIKLDQTMISKLGHDPRNRVIVRSIIRLCDLLDISVVAEGVETQDQLDILRRARCPMIQGFGLARPMPLKDTLTWLHDSTPLPDPVTFDRVTPASLYPLRQEPFSP